MQNMFFYQSGECVSHTVNIMLFFTSANPKCDNKTTKKHPASHSVTWVSKSSKLSVQWLQSKPRWTLEIVHCSHFCDFDASFFHFLEVRKTLIFKHFGQGPAAGGRGSSKLQIFQILHKVFSMPCSPEGVRRI